MSIVIVQPGTKVTLDPSDKRAVVFDWDAASLGSGVAISTSTFTITAIKQNVLAAALTSDNPAILTANQATTALGRTVAASRATRVRLLATTATAGDEYEVANTIVTDETPAQTKERSIRVLIENR